MNGKCIQNVILGEVNKAKIFNNYTSMNSSSQSTMSAVGNLTLKLLQIALKFQNNKYGLTFLSIQTEIKRN